MENRDSRGLVGSRPCFSASGRCRIQKYRQCKQPFPHSHETETPLYRSGRKKLPWPSAAWKKMGPAAPAATSFRAPSECHGF